MLKTLIINLNRLNSKEIRVANKHIAAKLFIVQQVAFSAFFIFILFFGLFINLENVIKITPRYLDALQFNYGVIDNIYLGAYYNN